MKHDNELPPQGQLIRCALTKYGWSQAKLAVETGFTEKHISQMITGNIPVSPYASVVIGHYLVPITAEMIMDAQTPWLIARAKAKFHPVTEGTALQQPAMFELDEMSTTKEEL